MRKLLFIWILLLCCTMQSYARPFRLRAYEVLVPYAGNPMRVAAEIHGRESVFHPLVLASSYKADVRDDSKGESDHSSPDMMDKRTNIIHIVEVAFVFLLLLFGLYYVRIKVKEYRRLRLENEEKSIYFTIISHDLKNPIAAQKQMVDIIYNNYYDFTEEEKLFCLSEFQKSSTELAELLDSMMQWATLNVGRSNYTPVRINLKTCIESCVREVRSQAAAKNITIVNMVQDQVFAQEDLHYTKVILRNLLTNALKFSYPGSSVEISMESTRKKFLISVVDHGVGISEEKLKEFFLYNMKSMKGTNGEKGSGLGLMICKTMLEKGGNELQVKSRLNEGSTFTFSVKKSD